MRRFAAGVVGLVALVAGVAMATAQVGPFSAFLQHPAIDYGTGARTDRVATLHDRIRSGEVVLRFDEPRGFLDPLLEALDVPVESQTLVFSQTSLQAEVIGPQNPRAIYFNDDVAVAWIRHAPAIEIAAHDPRQGVMFYVLRQQGRIALGFERPRSCIECHVSDTTLGVPGLAVGSVVTDLEGVPFTSVAIDHRSDIQSRWGGWYVTGSTGSGEHVGNTVAEDERAPELVVESSNLNLPSVDGRFDRDGYASPYSDVVALMVLEHQTHMTNLLTRAGWDFRVAAAERRVTGGLFAALERPRDAVLSTVIRDLVDYMLFIDEAPLDDAMRGTSGFAEVFEGRGPFDRRGRTLRTLDLKEQLFRYPCSYMIYTTAFDALPTDARDAVYRRLWQVLSGNDDAPRYGRLSSRDRRAVLEILRDTKVKLPIGTAAARP